MTLTSGTQLASYVILSPLGSGGMGEVYKARDPRLNRLVAIKVLPTSLMGDPNALARFEREAKTLAGLNHPNIVAIYDAGTANGIPFVVTELLEGDTLSVLMARGALPKARAIGIAIQIANGLAIAHEKGIVHRDLKPSNVIIGKGDHTKLLDFGLAKNFTLNVLDSATDAVKLPGQTLKGTILGTVGYMAPEQVRGDSADARSDLFALGVLFLEMLTGKQAFTGDSAVEVMHAILRENPLEGCLIPSELRPVIERLLAKDPEQRFQTAKDLAFVLASASSVESLHSSHQVRRKPWLLGLIASVALVASCIGYSFLQRTPLQTFQQITQVPSLITGARFLDENRVVFSQITPPGEEEVFEVNTSRTDPPRSLGIRGACVVSVSPRGEIAVILRQSHLQAMGRLAIIPASGGAPRQVMDGIAWADWGPNGDLILHHWKYQNGPNQVVEYPTGNILFQAPYWETGMMPPRLSGDRRFLAIPTLTLDGRNRIVILDLIKKTRREVLTKFRNGDLFGQYYTWGDQDFYMLQTASECGDSTTLLRLDGASEWKPVRIPMPGVQHLLDVSPKGRMLVGQGTASYTTRWRDSHRKTERYLDNQFGHLSSDGNYLLSSGITEIMEIWEPTVALPTRLENSFIQEGAPEKGTLIVKARKSDSEEVSLQPLGPGTSRTFPGRWGQIYVCRFPSGKKALIYGKRIDTQQKGSWIVDLQTMELTYLGTICLEGPVSPDGKWAFQNGPFGEGGEKATYLVSLTGDGVSPKAGILLPSNRMALVWKKDGSGFWIGPNSDAGSPQSPYPITLDFWRLGESSSRPDRILEAPKGGFAWNHGVSLSADGAQVTDTFSTLLPGHLFVVDGDFSRR